MHRPALPAAPHIAFRMSISASIRKFSLNIWSLTISQLLYRVVSLLLAVYMARVFGADDLGIYYTALGIVTIFTAFTDLGVTNLIIKEISQDRAKLEPYFRNFLSLQLLVGFVFFAAIALIGPVAGYPALTTRALLIGSFAPILAGVANCFNAALSAQELLYPFALIEMICLAFYAASVAILAALGSGVLALVAATTAASGLKLILAFRWGRAFGLAFRPRWDGALVRLLVGTGLPFMLFNGIHFALQRLDAVILPWYADQQDVGHFVAASRLIFSSIMFASVAMAALYPTLARLVKENRDRARDVAGTAGTFLFFAGGMVTLFCATAGEPFILFLYGETFASSVQPFMFLGMFIPVFSLGLVYGNLLVVAGEVWTAVAVSIVALLVFAGSAALLVPALGINGMAFSVLLSESVRTGGFLIGAARRLDIHAPLGKVLLLGAVAGAILTAFRQLPQLPVAVVAGVSLVLFIGAAVLFRIVRPDQIREMTRILVLPLRHTS